MEHRHRGLAGGGNLRAAVFGVNDGLLSNASLILGVAGASSRPARRRARGRRRTRGRRVLDGGRRVRLGALAARTLRVPDRPRARRAQAVPGGRGAGARADLRGQGHPQAAGASGRRPHRRRSRARARHARARGARPQSRRRSDPRSPPPRVPSAPSPPARRSRSPRIVLAPAANALPVDDRRLPPSRCSRSARRCRSSPAAARGARACGCWRSARAAGAVTHAVGRLAGVVVG